MLLRPGMIITKLAWLFCWPRYFATCLCVLFSSSLASKQAGRQEVSHWSGHFCRVCSVAEWAAWNPFIVYLCVYMLSIQFLICYRHRPNIASTMNTFCTSVSTTPCLSRCGASYASICWRETLASFSASSLHRPANSTAVVRRTKSRTNLATRPWQSIFSSAWGHEENVQMCASCAQSAPCC